MWRPFLLLLLAFTAPGIRAQPTDPVGEVARIAEARRKPVPATTRAVLWRSPGQPLRTRTTLVEQDRLEIKGDVWIDLHLRRDGLNSRVVLAPLQREGLYRIEGGTVTGIGGLRLVIERGAMLIEHFEGELEALAADISMIIHGTTVFITADSTGANCFLLEGRVSFPGYTVDFTGQNQMWRLESGQRPQRLDLSSSEIQQWRAQIQRASVSVRPVPLWQKPLFLIGTAVVVGAGAYALTRGGGDGASGTVVIPIPD